MKIDQTIFVSATLIASGMKSTSTHAFTLPIRKTTHHHHHHHHQSTINTPLYIASLSRPIDDELSSSSSSSASTRTTQTSQKSIMHEMHSILDDGQGHINNELATSIWTWENQKLLLHPDDKRNNRNNNNNKIKKDPFPLASKLKYSTRDGLRLIESTANDILNNAIDLYTNNNMDTNDIIHEDDEELYNDLVQEGVVALMKSYVVWGEEGNGGKNEMTMNHPHPHHPMEFEEFAKMEIKKAMREYLKQTSDGVGVFLDLLQRRAEELELQQEQEKEQEQRQEEGKNNNFNQSKKRRKQARIEPCDQIVQPLREAVLDENPTPDEIALSEMIRHDIGDFLERTLNKEELIVIRMRFGLEEVDTSLKAISLNLGKSVNDVQELEYNALCKLRNSFSNDYIGAYLDCDNTDEVSL